MIIKKNKTAMVTGSAGFIGFFVSKKLLDNGWRVLGIDSLSDYYDVSLKRARESILMEYRDYKSINRKIEEDGLLESILGSEKPDLVIHLAAQAGVRYSTQNPRAYINSNFIGTFELLEACRIYPPEHMLVASTSSVYGAEKIMPFSENQRSDHQMSLYAATKKSVESLTHSYSHLFDIPITIFRFFTVYGPWGRPDMAPFKFTKALLNGETIDVYNHGQMARDFTYVDDLVHSVVLLSGCIPTRKSAELVKDDSLSPVAPFRIVNIGNSSPVPLKSFIETIELIIGKKAKKNMMPIQQGDSPKTWANTNLLKSLTGFIPETEIKVGLEKFIKWYRDYYKI